MNNFIKGHNHNKASLPELTATEFSQLIKLFKEKNWEIDDPDNRLEGFKNTLQFLNVEQRQLLLEITKQFICIEISEYYRRFCNAFEKYVRFIPKKANNKTNLIILPLISENDFGKCKSSSLMLYLIKANEYRLNKKYKGIASISLVETNTYDKIDTNLLQLFHNENTKVCLIDDFLGSGLTAESAVKYLYNNNIVPQHNISVIALVAMQQGIDLLSLINVDTFSDIVCKKAITGTGDREQQRIKIMKSISERIGAKEECYLGYNNSEALIKMVRTPNNTFPVYWLAKNNKNPPFPR
jgi:hypothetical protein